MTEIIAKPFDWNDYLSKEAIEDFEGIQKDLPYCTCQSIGMALAKLELLEKQGRKVIDPSGSSLEKPNKCDDAISRKFEGIVVEYPPADLCIYPEYKGRPYFSIRYEENGEHIIGFGTYNPQVLTRYLQEYFISDIQPKTGHWIEDAGTYYKAIHERGCEPDENTPIFLDDIACSECLAKFSVIDNETERFECCPHCGAKMVEPQESEKINCKTTKCENCQNHNYCDYEPQESEEKPKSECEHDHEILKAYSDGANAVLDKIRDEIKQVKDNPLFGMVSNDTMLEVMLEIIDKYAEEDKA